MTDAERIAEIETVLGLLIRAMKLNQHPAKCIYCGGFNNTGQCPAQHDEGACPKAQIETFIKRISPQCSLCHQLIRGLETN